ncbi:iron-containing alcohol dehydrogenase [Thalassospira lucentensis]|uniref:Alcohol dehydrogenase 2 n=1 Tax=Thalassospira lucentensis TaxID=168935 RepID=A0A358HRW0_9PROT|nr:iron-containing alcohol dehydrogenase [Thalassospira lucentensis]HBU97928.1 alcohol dehydrogenase [Thalassospira lucentensis]HCW69114.1 alcohol dehydrogenase [Thalassospira lucentensis]|tara:strand:- start:251 stop:1405 length:1155 start_codon:yes stop_codon:yes gene_type:complete
MSFMFRSVPRIVCEAGGIVKAGPLMTELGATRVTIICDPGIVALGFADQAQKSLESVGIAVQVFSDVAADPPQHIVQKAIDGAKEWKADGVIGLGGGSSLDSAKLVALLANSDQTIKEIYGIDKAMGDRLPLIQIPTTAGTGSEVTWVSVITDPDNLKQVVYTPQLMPDIALLDAELTYGLPQKVTAATGLDAMVHAIEGYTSRTRKNPIADGMAVTALSLLGKNLMKVIENPGDKDARSAMLQGSLIAGMAFANASVAAIHGLAYPLGARFHIPHGHANALVMAQVLRFNLPAARTLYAELAPCLIEDADFASDDEAAEAFVRRIEEMVPASGLETRLRDLGVTEDTLPEMAEEVFSKIYRLIESNPCDMTTKDIEAIYREVY